MGTDLSGTVEAVHRSDRHGFTKDAQASVELVAGLGVAGDAHAGPTVRHRSRVRRNPDEPNLRQVHLIHGELHDELRAAGFAVGPGDLGENITTRGVDLLGLPAGSLLRLGGSALIAVTGLRNPCRQLDDLQAGLMAAVLDREADGTLVRKAGVMGIVVVGGTVRPGDGVHVGLPPGVPQPLATV